MDYSTDIGAACLDDSGRVQCAWVRHDTLKFALQHEPTVIVANGGGIAWCDIVTDALAQPVIAYCTNDGSIHMAHGVDVAGLSSEPRGTALRLQQSGATIVRGVLYLPRDMTETAGVSDRVPRLVLLDISGRKVMDLRPGGNDVSSVASGVYFVLGGEREAGNEGRIRKVVVQQ
jgi:hypothetical protein